MDSQKMIELLKLAMRSRQAARESEALSPNTKQLLVHLQEFIDARFKEHVGSNSKWQFLKDNHCINEKGCYLFRLPAFQDYLVQQGFNRLNEREIVKIFRGDFKATKRRTSIPALSCYFNFWKIPIRLLEVLPKPSISNSAYARVA